MMGLKDDRHSLAIGARAEMTLAVDGATTEWAGRPPFGDHLQGMVTERTHLVAGGNKTHGGHIIIVRIAVCFLV